jgi:hypothetical protein
MCFDPKLVEPAARGSPHHEKSDILGPVALPMTGLSDDSQIDFGHCHNRRPLNDRSTGTRAGDASTETAASKYRFAAEARWVF